MSFGPVGDLIGSVYAPAIGQAIDAKQNAKDANQAAKDNQYLNERLQKEFAQNGIRWKVEDAKAAGIHPLYALGANTASYSPVSTAFTPDTSISDFANSMGQNISRAVAATQTQQEREMNTLRIAGAKEDLKNKQLHNQILESQVSLVNQPKNPPLPGIGSAHEGLGSSRTMTGQSAAIKIQPSTTTATMPGQPSQEAAIIPDVSWVRTSSGGLAPVPSKDIKERIEDNLIMETMHAVRNNLMPNLGRGPKPPSSLLPQGYDQWDWSYNDQEYKPARRTYRSPVYKGYSSPYSKY